MDSNGQLSGVTYDVDDSLNDFGVLIFIFGQSFERILYLLVFDRSVRIDPGVEVSGRLFKSLHQIEVVNQLLLIFVIYHGRTACSGLITT